MNKVAKQIPISLHSFRKLGGKERKIRKICYFSEYFRGSHIRYSILLQKEEIEN